MGDHADREDDQIEFLLLKLIGLISEAMPDYAPCVSCHDPHGSGVDPVVDRSNPPRPSNRMLRGASNNTYSALCVPCHSLPQ